MSEEQIQPEVSTSSARPSGWQVVAAVLLLSVTAFSLVDLLRERRQAHQLAASNAELTSRLSQARSQLEDLSAKVSGLSAPTATAPARPNPRVSRTGVRHQAVTRTAKKPPRLAEDPRWKQVQSELAEHRAQITSTQQDVEKARSELEGKLKSTRDDLTASIAKTDGELAELKRRGERNYFEFNLVKSKQFQRVGPINLSLRKADTKHRRYDATMVVDDFELSKKHVNLFEPVLIYPADGSQALELVVNRIEKDRVHGYVSEPKYKPSVSAIGPATGTESSSPSHAETNLAHRSEPLH